MADDARGESSRDYQPRHDPDESRQKTQGQTNRYDRDHDKYQRSSDHHHTSRRKRHSDDDDDDHNGDLKSLDGERETKRRSRHRHRRRSPSRASPSSSSEEEAAVHPRLASAGLRPLTDQDYYAHSAPFRHWLLHSRKPKRLNDLSSADSHSLFAKFMDKYNRGRLPDLYYSKDGGITSASLATAPAGQTAHKWGFLAKRSAKEQEEVDLLRDGIDSLTNGTSKGARDRRQREMSSRRAPGEMEDDGHVIGPSLPPPPPAPSSSTTSASRAYQGSHTSSTDARLAAEEAAESSHRQWQAQRRAERRDAKDVREEAQPRSTGRDAVVEKRRETNRANREFEAARGAAEVELPEEQLMGGDASFQEALAAQQRSRSRQAGAHSQSRPRSKAQEVREAKRIEREEDLDRRREAFKAKEDGTMAMLRELAKSRFG